jgi:hypothetical protein
MMRVENEEADREIDSSAAPAKSGIGLGFLTTCDKKQCAFKPYQENGMETPSYLRCIKDIKIPAGKASSSWFHAPRWDALFDQQKSQVNTGDLQSLSLTTYRAVYPPVLGPIKTHSQGAFQGPGQVPPYPLLPIQALLEAQHMRANVGYLPRVLEAPGPQIEEVSTCLLYPAGDVAGESEDAEDEIWKGRKQEESRSGLQFLTAKGKNVPKSIIRKMYSRIRQQRDRLMETLQRVGYNGQQIEHAFYKISICAEALRTGTHKPSPLTLVANFTSRLSIYSFILHDTLSSILTSLDQGLVFRIARQNLTIYRDVCSGFYERLCRLIPSC